MKGLACLVFSVMQCNPLLCLGWQTSRIWAEITSRPLQNQPQFSTNPNMWNREGKEQIQLFTKVYLLIHLLHTSLWPTHNISLFHWMMILFHYNQYLSQTQQWQQRQLAYTVRHWKTGQWAFRGSQVPSAARLLFGRGHDLRHAGLRTGALPRGHYVPLFLQLWQ